MASSAVASTLQRRISLAQIDAIVSARLGPTRVPGNAQPACFSRQVAMYIARHVGRWSTSAIGHFYNGRDHSTVCYAIQRIEFLRESNPDVDALIAELKRQLGQESVGRTEITRICAEFTGVADVTVDQLADLVAARVWVYLQRRMHCAEPLKS